MLHIHNGSSTAGTLKEFGFPGEHLAFQEVLMEGPTPLGLSVDEWTRVRGTFLAESYDLQPEDCEKDLLLQAAALAAFSQHDETIMWFEHDLFCQINLIYLLDWFSRQSKSNARLSLICINEFPGRENFRGLGELTGEQMASLFEQRHEVADAEFELASKAWAAYCSTDPRTIPRLIGEGTTAMPFLVDALGLHLTRFPSLRNGLNQIENKSLELISGGVREFKKLFPFFGKTEPAYGLGDSQLWRALRRLGESGDPLITTNYPDPTEFKVREFHNVSFDITDTGRAVLAGESDFIHINGIDLWLGGVQLVGRDVWRWDDQQGQLTPPKL